MELVGFSFKSALTRVATVRFEIQNLGDVLPLGLTRRAELLPDMRRTSRVPPFHPIRESHVNSFCIEAVRFSNYTRRPVHRSPDDHSSTSYMPRQAASDGPTSGAWGSWRHGSSAGSSASGVGSDLSTRT